MPVFRIPPATQQAYQGAFCGTTPGTGDINDAYTAIAAIAGINVQRTDYAGGAKGDGTTDDTAALTAAVNAAGAGDVIFFPKGTYKYNQASLPGIPYQVSVIGNGPGTILAPTGSGAALYHHGDNSAYQPTFAQGGFIRNIVIDGTNAGTNSYGLDLGDGWGLQTSGVQIRHFNKTGSIGAYLANRTIWSEKCRFELDVQDCTDAIVFDTVSPNSLTSHVYSDYRFYIYATPGQNGIKVLNGSTIGLSSLFVRGNFQPSSSVNTNQAFYVGYDGSSAHIHYCTFSLTLETTGTNTYYPYTFKIGASGYVQNNMGIVAFLMGGWQSAILNGPWSLKGLSTGDTALTATL